MSLLNGKVTLVTGAGDGIGRGIALAFAREGADVAVCARRVEHVRETVRLASINDVANAFVFLASDLAANITAQDLRRDGGFSFKGGQAAV